MIDRTALDAGQWQATDFPACADRLAFNGRGTLLGVGCSEAGYATVLDVATGREVARVTDLCLHDTDVFEFFGDGLLGVWEDQIVCRDLLSGARDVLWAEDKRWPRSATVSRDGGWLAVGVSDGLILCDLTTRRSQRLVTNTEWAGRLPTFSPGGRYVAAVLFSETCGSFVMVWDTTTRRRWRTFDGPCEPGGAMAFRGDTLALASAYGGISLFEPDQGEDPTATFYLEGDAGAIQTAMQFLDETTLVIAAFGAGFILLDTTTGRVLRHVRPPGRKDVGYCCPNADWSLFVGATEEPGILLWGTGLN